MQAKIEEEERIAAEYDEGNKATRKRMLAKYREKVMVVAVARVQKQLNQHAKRSAVEQKVAEYYGGCQIKMLLTPMPVTGEKKVIQPEQGHSRAGPMRARRVPTAEPPASKAKAAELV